MKTETRRQRIALAAALCLLPFGGAAEAEITKADAQHWARRVHLLATPDEEKILKDLKDLADKEEFQRQFWARRTPDGASPNAFRDHVEALWKRADALFSLDGNPGSESGCGQVMALLGDPHEVAGRELKQAYDNQQYSRDGARRPELWIYRSRPADPVQFMGGELRIAFDEACRFGEGGRGLEELETVARRNIVRPAINYARGADGHLVRWSEPAAVTYAVRLEPKLLLRAKAGTAYAAGLVVAGPLAHAPGDTAARSVKIVTQALDKDGAVEGTAERTLAVPLGSDGTLVGSYGIAVKPGRRTVRVSVAVAGGLATATSDPIEVPDFDAAQLAVSPLLCYPEGSGAPDAQGPYAAFILGSASIAPRLGNAFTSADSLNVVATLYGGKLDPALGHAALRAAFTILKDGKPIAKGEDEVFEQPSAVASVGPVPLKGYAPGAYQIRLEARDTVAGTQEVREATFEVKP